MFSDAELVDLAKPVSELAEEALAAGDLERVRTLLGEMAVGHKPLHVLALHTLVRMWGKFRSRFGAPEAEAMLERIAAHLVAAWAEAWRSGDEKKTIAGLLAVYRNQAGARLTVAEDDAGLAVAFAPCGSGGMMTRQKWDEREPQWYAPFPDGTPAMCRGCKALQKAFNAKCGAEVWNTDIAPDRSGACRMTFRKQASAGGRLFDDTAELVETRPAMALAALAHGEMDTVATLIKDQHLEWKPWHDFQLCWLEYTFAAFHERGSYDLLQEAFDECYETVFHPRYEVFEQWSDAERVRRSAWTWHYHMGRIRIIEEQHRFVFVLDPCGSGARLFRGDVDSPPFRYGQPDAPLTREPHALSFGRRDFPLYCSHCAATNLTQFKGLPLIFIVDGHAQLRPGMPCRQYLYKKGAPRIVEPRLLDQVGLASVSMQARPNHAASETGDQNSAGPAA
jgi:hypothetical protein